MHLNNNQYVLFFKQIFLTPLKKKSNSGYGPICESSLISDKKKSSKSDILSTRHETISC